MRMGVLILLFVGLSLPARADSLTHPITHDLTQQEVEQRARGVAHRVARDIEQNRLPRVLDEALHNLIRVATIRLDEAGHSGLAMRTWYEYNERYFEYFQIVAERHDIPDKYPPLSEWLRNFYNTLEFIFGEPFMKSTRLFDIKVINNCIPVVFCLFGIEEQINMTQYEPYFVALAGTVTYWVGFSACVFGTAGTGFMFCAPIAWGAEHLMEMFLAPRLYRPAYNLFCD